MTSRARNPLLAGRPDGRPLVLDGGLATTLEDRGQVLADDLWSARVLLDDPAAVSAVHTAFLEAGADVIATVTYQATVQAFGRIGLSRADAVAALERAVALAVEARDRFWSQPAHRVGRARPLVAASVGPYGAYLADGSEYDGRYDADAAALYDFHVDRWRVLAASDADLLACETFPSRVEVGVVLRLLEETRDTWAWISCSCRDGRHLYDGSRLADVARDCHGRPGVAALGVNCTDPAHVDSLIAEVRSATDLPLLVYPNSGERYDARSRTWVAGSRVPDWEEAAVRWVRAGATGVGGCCRVGPDAIRRMRAALSARAGATDPVP